MSQLEEAARYLRSCGIERPEQDVKLLAAAAAGLPLSKALGAPAPEFDPAAEARFRRYVARRGEGREPAAYIVGTEEFMGLELAVSPSVLIPRPSTESLVERALPRLGPGRRFLEIGTGSGAVAVALARAGATGTATDLSTDALRLARLNAERQGVADRITFVEADLWADGTFDAVISNPPYVASAEFDTLSPEVLHEPRLALDGGADGLAVLRRIVVGARARAPLFFLECAPHQCIPLRELALQSGFRDVRISKDLDGFDRVVEAE